MLGLRGRQKDVLWYGSGETYIRKTYYRCPLKQRSGQRATSARLAATAGEKVRRAVFQHASYKTSAAHPEDQVFITAIPSMSAPNQNNPLAGFWSLPSELRNNIYHVILDSDPHANLPDSVRRVENGRVALHHHRLRPVYQLVQQPSNPILMQLTRGFRAEVGHIFFGTRTMYIAGYMQEMAVIAAYLERAVRDVGRGNPFASLTIDVRDSSWQNLQGLLPLVEVLRTTTLDENILMLSRGAQPGRWPNLATSLRRGVHVGVRARQQGWNQAGTMQEVEKWANEERQTDAALAAAAASMQQRSVRPRPVWYEGRKGAGEQAWHDSCL